jgi:hypothetical protein
MFDCPEARKTSPIKMLERKTKEDGVEMLRKCGVNEAFGVWIVVSNEPVEFAVVEKVAEVHEARIVTTAAASVSPHKRTFVFCCNTMLSLSWSGRNKAALLLQTRTKKAVTI